MLEFETLKRLVTEAEDDVNKAEGGNKAAGTRVRKKMQDIKSAAQEVRKKILEGRGAVVAHFEHQPNIGVECVSAGGRFANCHGIPYCRWP